MGLKQVLTESARAAQKSGDKERLEIVRFLLAQLQNREIEKRGELAEAEVLQVLQKEAKKRREAADLYRQGSRPELAAKEEKELAIIAEYLPAAPSPAEIEAAVEEALRAGASDLGGVMRAVMQKFEGRADGKLVREAASRKLPS